MPRPRSSRIIKCDPVHPYFKPRGIPLKDLAGEVELTLEELETIRLYNMEGLSQTKVGENMGISQTSVSRHLSEAHKKLATALVLGFAIRIKHPVDIYHCESCGHTWKYLEQVTPESSCEKCNSEKIHTHLHTSKN